jgi:hypothetical protein
MPEVQEVFHMATQKVRPDPNALERQYREQRRHAARQKAVVFALIGVLVIGGTVFAIGALRSDQARRDTVGTNPTASPLPTVEEGPLEPGRYVIQTLDPDFNASHRITIDVPDGYSGVEGVAVLKDSLQETGVGVWRVGYVFAHACEWRGAQSVALSADDVVTALAGQEALRPSTPTDVTVDGFAGTYMELTLPAGMDLGRCDSARFALWASGSGGQRYLNNPGQTELLWILDVNGAQVVIDAPLDADASAHDRAEVLQMVESIRIDSR